MKKPREFWIDSNANLDGKTFAYANMKYCPNMKENMIHVREVLPDEENSQEWDIVFWKADSDKLIPTGQFPDKIPRYPGFYNKFTIIRVRQIK